MQITSGLFDKMVLQRNGKNECNALIKGEFFGSGNLTVKVAGQNDFKVKNEKYDFDGDITHFKLTLSGLPVGGPYTITFKVGEYDTVTVSDVLVGDVWILAGQSNMQGAGLLKNDTSVPINTIRSFSNLSGTWDIAKNPLTQWEGEDLNNPMGVGPGLSFATEMFDYYGVPQGLIPCARGGSSMDQWSPDKKDETIDFYGETLPGFYGNMLRRVLLAGGKVAGMIWHQGCNDAYSKLANFYFDKMVNFIASIREDLHSPKLPVVIGQLSRSGGGPFGYSIFWNTVQDAQRRLPYEIKKLLMVPTIDLELDDGVHYSSKAQNVLGKRYFNAMRVLFDKSCNLTPPIQFKEAKVIKGDFGDRFVVEVSFKHVNGSLHAKGYPSGFDINYGDGPLDKYRVYKIDLKGKKAFLFVGDEYGIFEKGETMDLHYGYSIWPYCNIYDESDNPIPVFGPIKLQINILN